LCLSILRVRIADSHQLSRAHRAYSRCPIVCVLPVRLLFYQRPALAVRRVQHHCYTGSGATDLAGADFSERPVSTP